MKKHLSTWIILLAAVALGASLASLYVHYRMIADPTYTSFCDISETVSCEAVYESAYGTVRGVLVDSTVMPGVRVEEGAIVRDSVLLEGVYVGKGAVIEEVLAILNDYFDAVTRPVLARGGEILKFIGDAVLAIFPMKDDLDRDDKCRVALTAAEEALEAMRDVNELRASAGKAPLSIGIGLHAGSVSYGNIGSQTRLDFTVIGPAVKRSRAFAASCVARRRYSAALRRATSANTTPSSPAGGMPAARIWSTSTTTGRIRRARHYGSGSTRKRPGSTSSLDITGRSSIRHGAISAAG